MHKDRWISNNQSEFLVQGDSRGAALLADPARFEIPRETAEDFAESMKRYHAAFASAGKGGRSRAANEAKDEAMREAISKLRRIGNLVRSNRRISAATKLLIGIEDRAKPSKALSCPQEPPDMWFVRALHEGMSVTPRHELKFRSLVPTRARPDGAVRLELFIDLIGLDEPVPAHPGENYGGRPWYVGSFPRSPIVIAPPMPSVPMIMLYWARWAGIGACDVGPFCRTVVSPMVGGMKRFLAPQFNHEHKPMPLMEDPSEKREMTIRVAVLEMQRSMLLPNSVTEQTKHLEGPEQQQALEEAA